MKSAPTCLGSTPVLFSPTGWARLGRPLAGVFHFLWGFLANVRWLTYFPRLFCSLFGLGTTALWRGRARGLELFAIR